MKIYGFGVKDTFTIGTKGKLRDLSCVFMTRLPQALGGSHFVTGPSGRQAPTLALEEKNF